MKRNLITGLSILVPFVITIWVFVKVLRKLTNPFINQVKSFLLQFHLIQMTVWNENNTLFHLLAQVLIILVLILFTIGLGILTKNYLIGAIISNFEKVLERLPFLRSIYPPIKRALKLLFDSNIKLVKRSVLIPFPSTMSQSLAIEIGLGSLKSVEKALKTEVDTYLLPTAPNPLMGFVLFVKKDQSKEVSISVEQTIKYMISLGLLQPENA